tara:strand:+ start:69 stop:731 length:663 start_codon:yes stop_codon:yes gene_type:complete
LNKAISYLGGLFSLALSSLVVFWVFDVFDREISQLPVIEAVEKNIKETLPYSEIETTKYKGYEVNEVLENSNTKIIINDQNQIQLDTSGIEKLGSSYESPPLKLKEKNNFNSNSELTKAITSALESLLGDENAQDHNFDNVNIIQLGSYENEEDANIHKYILNQNYSSIFQNINLKIIKTENNNKRFYRLRGYGFENYYKSKEICDFLNKRGEKCLLVKE